MEMFDKAGLVTAVVILITILAVILVILFGKWFLIVYGRVYGRRTVSYDHAGDTWDARITVRAFSLSVG